MQQWSPFWRWLAAGVLVVMTVAWVAQSVGGSHESRNPRRRVEISHLAASAGGGACAPSGAEVVTWSIGDVTRQVCVGAPTGALRVTPDGTVSVANGTGSGQTTAVSAALQRQEAELQAQQAQLSARIAALQARLNSLGQ